MPYYNLLVVQSAEILSHAAHSREHALEQFGEHLGLVLTFEGDGVPPYLFDEWSEGPHWVNPTVPVFQIRD